MNITGYKNKLKSMNNLLREEEEKKNSSLGKIERLTKSKLNCNRIIKRLQKESQKKRDSKPRKTIKRKKGRRKIFAKNKIKR